MNNNNDIQKNINKNNNDKLYFFDKLNTDNINQSNIKSVINTLNFDKTIYTNNNINYIFNNIKQKKEHVEEEKKHTEEEEHVKEEKNVEEEHVKVEKNVDEQKDIIKKYCNYLIENTYLIKNIKIKNLQKINYVKIYLSILIFPFYILLLKNNNNNDSCNIYISENNENLLSNNSDFNIELYNNLNILYDSIFEINKNEDIYPLMNNIFNLYIKKYKYNSLIFKITNVINNDIDSLNNNFDNSFISIINKINLILTTTSENININSEQKIIGGDIMVIKNYDKIAEYLCNNNNKIDINSFKNEKYLISFLDENCFCKDRNINLLISQFNNIRNEDIDNKFKILKEIILKFIIYIPELNNIQNLKNFNNNNLLTIKLNKMFNISNLFYQNLYKNKKTYIKIINEYDLFEKNLSDFSSFLRNESKKENNKFHHERGAKYDPDPEYKNINNNNNLLHKLIDILQFIKVYNILSQIKIKIEDNLYTKDLTIQDLCNIKKKILFITHPNKKPNINLLNQIITKLPLNNYIYKEFKEAVTKNDLFKFFNNFNEEVDNNYCSLNINKNKSLGIKYSEPENFEQSIINETKIKQNEKSEISNKVETTKQDILLLKNKNYEVQNLPNIKKILIQRKLSLFEIPSVKRTTQTVSKTSNPLLLGNINRTKKESLLNPQSEDIQIQGTFSNIIKQKRRLTRQNANSRLFEKISNKPILINKPQLLLTNKTSIQKQKNESLKLSNLPKNNKNQLLYELLKKFIEQSKNISSLNNEQNISNIKNNFITLYSIIENINLNDLNEFKKNKIQSINISNLNKLKFKTIYDISCEFKNILDKLNDNKLNQIFCFKNNKNLNNCIHFLENYNDFVTKLKIIQANRIQKKQLNEYIVEEKKSNKNIVKETKSNEKTQQPKSIFGRIKNVGSSLFSGITFYSKNYDI